MRPSRALLRLLSIFCVAVLHSSFVHAADIDVGASCSLADAITAANTERGRRRLPARERCRYDQLDRRYYARLRTARHRIATHHRGEWLQH